MTEPTYFEELKTEFEVQDRLAVIVEGGGGGDPVQIVEKAIRLRGEAEARADAMHDENARYDLACVVVDVDDHARIEEATEMGEDADIRVLASNPCFELWALLHFENHGAGGSCGDIRKLLRKHLPHYEKELPFQRLAPNYMTAVERARRLKKHRKNQGRPGGNPSTEVHRLTQTLRRHGRGEA